MTSAIRKLPPGVAEALEGDPLAEEVGPGRSMANGDIARQIIARTRAFAAIDGAGACQLVALIARGATDEGRLISGTIAGVDVRVDVREIYAPRRLLMSGTAPGLFKSGEVPEDDEAHEAGLALVNEALSGLRGGLQASGARAAARSWSGIDRQTIVTAPVPGRRRETYEISAQFAHRTDRERRAAAQLVARVIEARWLARRDVDRRRKRIGEDVAAALSGSDGVTVVGTGFSVDPWAMHYHGVFKGRAYAAIQVLGETLEQGETRISEYIPFEKIDAAELRKKQLESVRDQVRHALAKHRANQRSLAATGSVAIDPVLMRWAMAMPVRYLPRLLEEIEAVVGGRALKAQNPRRRGISGLSIDRGVVKAPIHPVDGISYAAGRMRIRPGPPTRKGEPSRDRTMPRALVAAMRGKPATAVAGHPCLEGLTIKTATTDRRGLHLRFVETPMPHDDAIAALRRRLDQGDGA